MEYVEIVIQYVIGSGIVSFGFFGLFYHRNPIKKNTEFVPQYNVHGIVAELDDISTHDTRHLCKNWNKQTNG